MISSEQRNDHAVRVVPLSVVREVRQIEGRFTTLGEEESKRRAEGRKAEGKLRQQAREAFVKQGDAVRSGSKQREARAALKRQQAAEAKQRRELRELEDAQRSAAVRTQREQQAALRQQQVADAKRRGLEDKRRKEMQAALRRQQEAEAKQQKAEEEKQLALRRQQGAEAKQRKAEEKAQQALAKQQEAERELAAEQQRVEEQRTAAPLDRLLQAEQCVARQQPPPQQLPSQPPEQQQDAEAPFKVGDKVRLSDAGAAEITRDGAWGEVPLREGEVGTVVDWDADAGCPVVRGPGPEGRALESGLHPSVLARATEGDRRRAT
eukprot:gene3012-2615_t